MEFLRPFDDLPQIELDQHGPLYSEYTWSSLGGGLDALHFYGDAFAMKRLDVVDTELLSTTNSTRELSSMQRFLQNPERPLFRPASPHQMRQHYLKIQPYEAESRWSKYPYRHPSPDGTTWSSSSGTSWSSCTADDRRLPHSSASLSQNYHGSAIVQDSYYSGSSPFMYSNETHSGGDSFIALRQIQQYPDEEPDDSEGYPCSDIKIESAACEQESIYFSGQTEVDVSHNSRDVVDEGLGESIRDAESVQPCSKEEEEEEDDPDYRPTSPSPALRRRKRQASQSSTGSPARKRHVSSQHMRLGFWRCDQCPESDSRPNDFNRKDLFIQHLRRMHCASLATVDSIARARRRRSPAAPSLSTKRSPSSSSAPPSDAMPDALLAAASARCYRRLRAPPPQSSCLFCDSTFSGAGSWDLRMEHVGRHLEADRKAGTAGVAGAQWRVDDVLAAWLEAEGLVVREGGGWRLGRGE
ncbi:hypothetical protein LTR16_001361 [Cryomyces antarcticus]|uniref:C2H2-type domain-containing protein n=1 Tax=Cryomyces antarcticus TaxID=329879 RepID=A0ABR0KU08_9PEZI|nr:hypothetical protein LTR16_001361 [Cryomyces antarcticus]